MPINLFKKKQPQPAPHSPEVQQLIAAANWFVQDIENCFYANGRWVNAPEIVLLKLAHHHSQIKAAVFKLELTTEEATDGQ